MKTRRRFSKHQTMLLFKLLDAKAPIAACRLDGHHADATRARSVKRSLRRLTANGCVTLSYGDRSATGSPLLMVELTPWGRENWWRL
jgi:hypothetical protein